MRAYNFFAGGPNFTSFFINAGRILVNNAVLRLSISLWVLKIFAVKVKSCLKSHLFWTFLTSQILNVVPALSPPPSGTSTGEVSRGYSLYRQSYRHTFGEL